VVQVILRNKALTNSTHIVTEFHKNVHCKAIVAEKLAKIWRINSICCTVRFF